MSDTENIPLEETLHNLRLEHRDLDDIIQRLHDDPSSDQLMIRRLKKRKLLLKDMIRKIESKLLPDLNA